MSPILTELGGMSFKITPLPDRKKWHPGRTKSLKLYFQISNETLHRFIHHSNDGQQQQLPRVSSPKSVDLWMDAAQFGQQTAEELFAPELEKVGIVWSRRSADVVSKVREEVKGVMRSVQKRRKVMVISVEIKTEVTHRMFESGLQRAAWELFANASHGMAAAEVDEAKKMMKAVRIGEKGEARECIICLEEMKKIGIGLPCQHLFHANCILQWLQTSHYCPLCRFQLPT